MHLLRILNSGIIKFWISQVLIIHGMVIYPYFLGKVSVPNHIVDSTKVEDTFDVLIANVLIDNRESERFLKIAQKRNPDILLAMEVDGWWSKELQVLEDKDPYKIEYPLDNAYGMYLYSKLPMEKKDIKF